MASISHQPDAFPWRVWHGLNGRGDYVTFHRVLAFKDDGSAGFDYVAVVDDVAEVVIYADQVDQYESLGHALMAHVSRAVQARNTRRDWTEQIRTGMGVPGDPHLRPVVDHDAGTVTYAL